MERVTVEQNGERFTLEVEDGTTDEQIKSFLAQQQQTSAGLNLNEPGPQVIENIAAQAPAVASGAARELVGGAATANMRDAVSIGKNATSWTPNALMEVVTHPLETARAYVGGHPWANTPIKQLAGGIGKNIAGAAAQGLLAPENLMTLPYNMAAYEQAKIRENPNAPGLQSNPYAQVVRGEAATQNRAGAANQMRTVANMPYGNVSAQERAILDEDARMRQNIRRKAYEKVMGPVVPGSF